MALNPITAKPDSRENTKQTIQIGNQHSRQKAKLSRKEEKNSDIPPLPNPEPFQQCT